MAALLLLLLFCGGSAQAQPEPPAQCTAGDEREVFVGCRSGVMTYPPRTERCAPSPRAPDWYLLGAELGTHELGGTGGDLRLFALPARDFDAQAAERAVEHAIRQARQQASDTAHVARLERLLQRLRQRTVPLAQADAVAGEVTLRAYAQPHSGWDGGLVCDANPTAGACPQVEVPRVRVTLVCLPQSR